MKMLKTKHFRRLVVFLAMIAPAVYLFGSLFCALTGAHGEQVFADDSSVELSYDAENFENIVYDGNGSISSSNAYLTSNYMALETPAFDYDFVGNFSVVCFVFFDENYSFVSRPIVYSGDLADTTFNGVYTQPSNAVYVRFMFGNALSVSVDVCRISYNVYEHDSLVPVGNSNYVFGQFFTKDNFLIDWGRNAISEDPRGFAPFGAFWRYLDSNVLHLSNDQMGLMGYGYIYYCCHVLLFDIGFILVTFFLDFIQKVADKFTGGE